MIVTGAFVVATATTAAACTTRAGNSIGAVRVPKGVDFVDYGFGDSDGTLNVIVGIGVQFGETFGMNFGYRHATIEFEQVLEGVQEGTDISLSGPIVGVSFRF